jgi:hypothetical protein
VSTSSGRCRSPANCSAYVPVRILADRDQDLADRPLDPVLVDGRPLADGLKLGRQVPGRRLIQGRLPGRRLFG